MRHDNIDEYIEQRDKNKEKEEEKSRDLSYYMNFLSEIPILIMC